MTAKKQPGRADRKPRTLEEKLAALKELDEGERYGVRPKEIAAKHDVSEATIYLWRKQRAAGKLAPPKKPGVPPKPERQPRRQHADAFKAKVVEDYIQRRPEETGEDIAQRHGISRSLLSRWLENSRNGEIPAAPEPDRSDRQRIVPRPQPASVLHAQLSLAMGDADMTVSPPLSSMPIHIQFYVQRLEAQNKALRKMLQVAMEAI